MYSEVVSASTLLQEGAPLGTGGQGGRLSATVFHSPLVMQCSAAVDLLFLIDGSHSVGKGSFERSKHFAITVCDALDINPERVSASLIILAFGHLGLQATEIQF